MELQDHGTMAVISIIYIRDIYSRKRNEPVGDFWKFFGRGSSVGMSCLHVPYKYSWWSR